MRAVNLMPLDQRAGAGMGAGRSGGVAYGVLALLGGVALLAFLYGRAEHQISSRSAQVSSLNAQVQNAQAEASRLGPYTSFAALREQRIKEVTELVDARFDWAHLFHELGRVLPQQVSLTSVTGTVGSATGAGGAAAAPGASSTAGSSSSSASGSSGAHSTAVTSATPPGTIPQLTISGCATSQPEVAVMLERLHLMDGASAVTLQSSSKSTPGSAGGGGTGSCPAGDPVFTAQVSFEPLPTAAATSAATVALAANHKAGTP